MSDPTCSDLEDGKPCEWYQSQECPWSDIGYEEHPACVPVLALLECRARLEHVKAMSEVDGMCIDDMRALLDKVQADLDQCRRQRDHDRARCEALVKEIEAGERVIALKQARIAELEQYRGWAAEQDCEEELDVAGFGLMSCRQRGLVELCVPCRARKNKGE